jgi:hypothetical protein
MGEKPKDRVNTGVKTGAKKKKVAKKKAAKRK